MAATPRPLNVSRPAACKRRREWEIGREGERAEVEEEGERKAMMEESEAVRESVIVKVLMGWERGKDKV